MTARRSALPPALMSQKTSPNPSAVPLESVAAVEQPAPAPVQVVEAKEVAAIAPEVAPQPAAPVVEVAQEQVQPEPAATTAPAPAQSALFFPTPVHHRSKKQRSSQMSVQVPAKLFQLVDTARKEIDGMSGQTILMEGLIMWLIHNRFITPEEAAELLKEQM